MVKHQRLSGTDRDITGTCPDMSRTQVLGDRRDGTGHPPKGVSRCPVCPCMSDKYVMRNRVPLDTPKYAETPAPQRLSSCQQGAFPKAQNADSARLLETAGGRLRTAAQGADSPVC